MEFLNTPEHTEAPVLGAWKAYYYALMGFFFAEVVLFSYLTIVY